jgi:hypothetical protein
MSTITIPAARFDALSTSPLLLGLLTVLPRDVLEEELLGGKLDSTALAMFSRCGTACRAAVAASGLRRAGEPGGLRLCVGDFVDSVNLLAWAKAHGCPWNEKVCESITCRRGNLQVLTWWGCTSVQVK